jgi:hypothetical protein
LYEGQKISGDEAAFPRHKGGIVSSEGMYDDAGRGSGIGAQALGAQGADDAGKQVSHAARTHAGIAKRAKADAIRGGDQAAGSLENGDATKTVVQGLSGGNAVLLHLGGAQSQ